MDRYAVGCGRSVAIRGSGFLRQEAFGGSADCRCHRSLSYSTGAQFGAVVISSTASLFIIAAVWVVVFGVVFELARRVQQTGPGENNNPQAAG